MWRKVLAAAVAAVLVCAWAAAVSPEVEVEKDLSEDLIRFHVIANSDSPQDQQLKQEVRDAILERVGSRFAKAKSLAEARNIVLASLDDMEAAAGQEIAAQGMNYPVKAQLGNFNFPAKTYGSFSLPAGNYEAVRVVIGEGKGANWWCVLFPPLCFVDISNSVTTEPPVTEVSKDVGDRELSGDEDAGAAAGREQEPGPGAELHDPAAQPVIEFKFKLFEMFNRSRDFMAQWRQEKGHTLFVRN